MSVRLPSNFIRTFVASRWFFAIGLILLGLLCIAFGKVVYQNYETHQDIASLQDEYKSLQNNQGKLKELNEFLQTDFFAEREARIKLGMQKKDEHAIVIQDLAEPVVQQEKQKRDAREQRVNGGGVQGEETNLRAWWNYFFKSAARNDT